MLPPKPKKIPHIYLDHAATTPTDPKVVKAMLPYFTKYYGNPSSLHSLGVVASNAIQTARRTIADILHTEPYSIFFTSGATESINTAILGTARAHHKHGNHIITSRVEHPAALEALRVLENEGFEVTYLPVDTDGQLSLTSLKKALKKETILVSLMYANNEIGTIYPLADIGRMILKHRKENKTVFPYFHTDASQATTTLLLDVEKLHVDLLSFNGSKLYGPKGIGVLYKRKHTTLTPLLYGGGQEMHLRSGTEHVPGIVGIATALALAEKHKSKEVRRLADLQQYFWYQLQQHIPSILYNGPGLQSGQRLVNNVNVLIPGVDAEALIIYLNAYGIYCSSGSACATGEPEASHVLSAIGRNPKDAASSLRFTMGKKTTKKDIVYTVRTLAKLTQALQHNDIITQ